MKRNYKTYHKNCYFFDEVASNDKQVEERLIDDALE